MKKLVITFISVALVYFSAFSIIKALGNKQDVKPIDVGSIVVESEKSREPKPLIVPKKVIHADEAQQCSIIIQIDQREQAKVAVLNEKGEQVELLVDQELEPGPHVFFWNTAKVSAGSYFIYLKTKDQDLKEKLDVLR